MHLTHYYRWAIVLALLTAAGRTWADRAADEAAWEKIRVRQLAPLVLETAVVREGKAVAAIVPAEGEAWTKAAASLQRTIAAKTGVLLPLVAPAMITDADWASRNLIVLGNLLNNPVYARLYHNFFVCADAAYTGSGGYELRTVHDPWGTGHNAIALGAQDDAGIAAGAERLARLIEAQGKAGELKFARLLELNLSKQGRRAPLEGKLSDDDVKRQKAGLEGIYDRPGTERTAEHRTARFAMMYHRTGDPGYLELYRHAVQKHIEYYAKNEYIQQEGPRRYDRDFRDSWAYQWVIAWDLVEEAPGWSDAERLAIVNHVQRLVWECNMYQHWDSKEAVESWRKFKSVTHNHHTWPGLANLFGGWYFTRHYQSPVANDWLTIATSMFRSCSHSSKPWEDSASYQWIPQRHVLTYALASGDHTYIDEGHAAETAKALLMAIDSLGHQPAFGDHDSFTSTSYMPQLLSGLEYATGSGACRWVIEHLNLEARGEMEEPYWTNVRAQRPDELTGASVCYLPKIHFDLFGSNADFFQKPNVPFAHTFNKLVLRTGWEANDDYLMIDGTAAGSHGHLDGNAIVDFTSAGAHWLVDGEYIRRLPKYHCAVTVLREGVSTTMPPSARLEHAAWFGEGALSRTTMPHYNGMSWTRNLIYVAKKYVAVVDEVTAEQPGNYSVRCCWRVYGDAQLDGDNLRVRQGAKGFALRQLSGHNQELVYIRDAGNLGIHQLYQRAGGQLQAGQSFRFINVFAAAENGAPQLDAFALGESRGAIRWNGQLELFGANGLDEGVSTDAAVYRLTPKDAWVAGAKRFVVGKQDYLAASEPAYARFDDRGLALGMPQPVPAKGLRPAYVAGTAKPLTQTLDLPKAFTALNLTPVKSAASASPAFAAAKSVAADWRFDGFSAAPASLKVASLRSDVPPKQTSQPLERLIDGKCTSSTTSCLFPPGKKVNVTLDLGSVRRLSEVRVDAWDSVNSWKLKELKLSVSNDDFQKDCRAVGSMKAIGRHSSSTQSTTVYGALGIDQEARYVRVTGEPLSAGSSVYLAEIEVAGNESGQRPKLVALATADLRGDGQPGAVVATDSGEIVALDAAGKKLWAKMIGAPVTALAAGALTKGGKVSVIYGTANAFLGVLNAQGEEVARTSPPAYRGVASRVNNISLGDINNDGTMEIVIGCQSWQYIAYTPELKLVWKCVYYAHQATVAHLADFNGDGKLETLAGNAYYVMQMIDSRGKIIGRGERFGPEQTAATSADFLANGKRAAILGADDGTVIAFDCAGTRQWRINLGDRVTSMFSEKSGPQARILAASDSGYVWALDPAGHAAWKCDLAEPVKRLASSGSLYAAAASSLGVVWLSPEGRVTAACKTAAPIQDLAAAGQHVYALLGDGSVIRARAP